MEAFTSTFNTIYEGLGNLESKTFKILDGFDKGYSALKSKYSDAMGAYATIKKDISEAEKALDSVCQRVDTTYQQAMKMFDQGTDAINSVVSRFKGIFSFGKKSAQANAQANARASTSSSASARPTAGPAAQKTYEKPAGAAYEKTEKQSSNEKARAQTQPSAAYHAPAKEPYVKAQEKASALVEPAKPVIPKVEPVQVKPETRTVVEKKVKLAAPVKPATFGLDDLVNDFKQKLKQFNPSYDVKVDVYDKESVVKSYAVGYKSGYEPKIETSEIKTKYSDAKYSDLSVKVTELYNQGYRTKKIIKEAVKQGYSAIKNYDDVTELVVAGIKSGISYAKNKYNNAIASKLGAKEQIVSDYLSGKSYTEIKENLKNKTNGMGISDSSILRTMHKYEKEAGKKVVNNRRNTHEAKSGAGNGRKK